MNAPASVVAVGQRDDVPQASRVGIAPAPSPTDVTGQRSSMLGGGRERMGIGPNLG